MSKWIKTADKLPKEEMGLLVVLNTRAIDTDEVSLIDAWDLMNDTLSQEEWNYWMQLPPLPANALLKEILQ